MTFVLLSILIMYGLSCLVKPREAQRLSKIRSYEASKVFNEKDNSLDVIFFGHSGVYSGISPMELYRGIQYYSGTQKKSDKIYKEIDMLTAFVRDLTERYGKKINRIEYGPGLSVRYFEGEKEYCEEEVLREISSRLEADFDGKIVLEMGRFIAAECGEYVTSVVDLKKNGENAYCIVDGGINHLNYYGQMMAMKFPFIRHYQNKPMQKDDAPEKWNICGSLCTTADVLVKSYPLANLKKGDRLVFEKTGAYSVTEGIYLFLSRDMPYIYKVTEQGELKKVRQALQTDKINSERRN